MSSLGCLHHEGSVLSTTLVNDCRQTHHFPQIDSATVCLVGFCCQGCEHVQARSSQPVRSDTLALFRPDYTTRTL